MGEDGGRAQGKGEDTKGDSIKLSDITEHLWDLSEVSSKYGVKINMQYPGLSEGLGKNEVEKRRQEHGRNELPVTKRTPKALVFLKMLFGLFNIMLLVAGTLSFLFAALRSEERTQNLSSGLMLIIVVLVNASIEFYENQKGDAVVKSFESCIATKCGVVREGEEREILSAELVPGDVVHLRLGDRSPADIMLFNCAELLIESSSLTGESIPVEKCVQNDATNPLDALNLVFGGSLVVGGEGYGIALRTGSEAAIARIVSITDSARRTVSPLIKELSTIVKLCALIAVVMAICILPYLIYKQKTASAAVLFVVGLFISIVPQGLPVCVPIVLESAHRRLSKTNVLVKDLYSIETLGSVTIIATDKTGTITKNQMEASVIWARNNYFYATPSVTNVLHLDHAVIATLDDPLIKTILEASILCSRAELIASGPDGTFEVTGSATDTGLMKNALRFIPDPRSLRSSCQKIFEIPFNSELKYCITIHAPEHPNGPLRLLMKGAPERVFTRCKQIVMGNGEKVLINKQIEDDFHRAYDNIASKGHRVLAFAGLTLDAEQFPSNYAFSRSPRNFPSTDLDFYGLVSLEDPPKHGVREAIGLCRRGGLKVIMITGDHPVTAEAIARRVNIITRDSVIVINEGEDLKNLPRDGDCGYYSLVITGNVLSNLSDDEWTHVLSADELIFARTSPGHKLEVVKRAQALGHIVGVTGDGVNDAPALKKADVGISMNKGASEVPREAAKIILLDDNFATLVIGIVEGRKIYKKLRRTVRYTLTHVSGEGIPLLLSTLVPLPHMLGSLLILFFDLCFELFISISYAWERKEGSNAEIMSEPPRIFIPGQSPGLKGISPEEKSSKFSLKNLFRIRKVINPSRSVQSKSLTSPPVLFWSYIYAGLLETCGCLCAYFLALYVTYIITPFDLVNFADTWGTSKSVTLLSGRNLSMEDQKKAENLGRTTWFYSLCVQQLWNYFACIALDQKRLTFSTFIPSVPALFLILLSATLSLLLLIPQISVYFQIDPGIKLYVIGVPMIFGAFIYLSACLNVILHPRLKSLGSSRVGRTNTFGKLEMHPTAYTVNELV